MFKLKLLIENWYIECTSKGILEHKVTLNGVFFIIFKGFKILKNPINENTTYEIFDVRKLDSYTSVKQEEIEIFKEHGFLKGASHLEYYRSKRRVAYYSDRIDREMRKIRGHKRKLNQNPTKHKKAINVANNKILELAEELHKYTEKCRKYESKL